MLSLVAHRASAPPVGALAGALLILAAAPFGSGQARADCLQWSDPGLTIAEGTLRGLPPGPARWRAGTQPAGGGHVMTQVELRWTARDGQERRQAIFSEIQDGTPAVTARRGRATLHVLYCLPGRPSCRGARLPYAWDPAQHRFVGASRRAQQSLAEACWSAQPG